MTASRRLVLVLALGALVSACGDGREIASPAMPSVLVVEEAGHAPPDRETMTLLDRFVTEFDPRQRVRWQVRHVRPTSPDDLSRAIEETEPRVVILLNDDLVGSLGDRARTVPIVLASERSRTTLAADLESLRIRHPIAALTWYSDSHARLIDLLSSVRGEPVRSIVAFYHPVLDAVGLPQDFDRAARSRGVRIDERRYGDISGLKEQLEAMRGTRGVEALFIPLCSETFLHMEAVARLANATGLPAAYTRRDQVQSGGLLSVDAPDGEVWKQIARYTVLLLNGADPRALDIAGPTRHEAAVNLRAAMEIGVVVPYETLVEAVSVYR